MKKNIAVVIGLAVASAATAQNVPSGLTGLWRFQDSAHKFSASTGSDLASTSDNAWFSVPWTVIDPGMSDGGGIQTLSGSYLTVNHGIAPNGGGSFVNDYTISLDYQQTSLAGLSGGNYYNSLFQTGTANDGDGDIFIKGPDRANSVIGVGDTGYSTLTFDSEQWHRITWSVDNGSFYRIYVDGTLYLDAPGQAVDGRFSLDPTFLLFADNDGEDAWGIVSTAMVWDHALTSSEIAGMGGPTTPLNLVPEPATFSLMALGGLLCVLRRGRR